MKSTAAPHRPHLLKELEKRYSSANEFSFQRMRVIWKRNAWYGTIFLARFIKRLIDILGSLTGLLLLLPLFICVALAIYIHDRGPIFFVQKRVGQWGREFDFPKFRSMVCNAEALKAQLLNKNQHKNGITFKINGDPRVTPVGSFIRKTSIDELPQLWSVLKGDMSLVGPRPPIPSEVLRYKLSDRRRLDVKPGLTCYWQVEGRGDVPFEQQVEMDIRYVDSQSLWLDMWLLLKTIPAVIQGKGAY
jgi:lipopolysaccharide/colanic/teichoic acid biosynthesis glycosyltransferase